MAANNAGDEWLPERDGDFLTVEELAERQGVRLGKTWEDHRCDIWESDEELEAFLKYTYESRRASIGDLR